MMQAIKAAIASRKNPFVESDGSICPKRILATIAATVMIYKFARVTGAPDYLSLGGGLSAIFAALAFVNKSEQGDKCQEEEEERDHDHV